MIDITANLKAHCVSLNDLDICCPFHSLKSAQTIRHHRSVQLKPDGLPLDFGVLLTSFTAPAALIDLVR